MVCKFIQTDVRFSLFSFETWANSKDLRCLSCSTQNLVLFSSIQQHCTECMEREVNLFIEQNPRTWFSWCSPSRDVRQTQEKKKQQQPSPHFRSTSSRVDHLSGCCAVFSLDSHSSPSLVLGFQVMQTCECFFSLTLLKPAHTSVEREGEWEPQSNPPYN